MQRIFLIFRMLISNHITLSYRLLILGSLSLVTLTIIIFLSIIGPLVQSFITKMITTISNPREHSYLNQCFINVDKKLDKNFEKFQSNNFNKNQKFFINYFYETINNDKKIGIYEYLISYNNENFSLQESINNYQINQFLQKLNIRNNFYNYLKKEEILESLNLKKLNNEIYNYKYFFNKNNFIKSIMNISEEWHNVVILKGQLYGNFINSARAAGLTNSDINSVIQALQWQLDFRKLRTGDQFSVLTLCKIINGKNIHSQLLGVRLCTKGKNYYAFRAENGNFYKSDGDATCFSLNGIRLPTIKKFRVSSHFNMNRRNPITGRIVPHRGVDFAMPIGTPVLSVDDGEVIISKNGGSAGNYIVIQHSKQYTTRYMHLNKLLVKSGQKVKRGECIASSGNTGRSTGPHLHFEVWINQKAVNPLTAQLPHIKNLTGQERLAYLMQVKKILPYLHDEFIS